MPIISTGPFRRIVNVHWNNVMHVAVMLTIPNSVAGDDKEGVSDEECGSPGDGPGIGATVNGYVSAITYRYTADDFRALRRDGTWEATDGSITGLATSSRVTFDPYTTSGPQFNGGATRDTSRFIPPDGAALGISLPDAPSEFFKATATARLEYKDNSPVAGSYCGRNPLHLDDPPGIIVWEQGPPAVSYGEVEIIGAMRFHLGDREFAPIGTWTPESEVDFSIGTFDTPKDIWVLLAPPST